MDDQMVSEHVDTLEHATDLMSSVEAKIREAIVRSHRLDVDPGALSDELTELDSLQTLELIVALEEEFEVIFEDDDLDFENFESVTTIAALVRSRMEGSKDA